MAPNKNIPPSHYTHHLVQPCPSPPTISPMPPTPTWHQKIRSSTIPRISNHSSNPPSLSTPCEWGPAPTSPAFHNNHLSSPPSPSPHAYSFNKPSTPPACKNLPDPCTPPFYSPLVTSALPAPITEPCIGMGLCLSHHLAGGPFPFPSLVPSVASPANCLSAGAFAQLGAGSAAASRVPRRRPHARHRPGSETHARTAARPPRSSEPDVAAPVYNAAYGPMHSWKHPQCHAPLTGFRPHRSDSATGVGAARLQNAPGDLNPLADSWLYRHNRYEWDANGGLREGNRRDVPLSHGAKDNMVSMGQGTVQGMDFSPAHGVQWGQGGGWNAEGLPQKDHQARHVEPARQFVQYPSLCIVFHGRGGYYNAEFGAGGFAQEKRKDSSKKKETDPKSKPFPPMPCPKGNGDASQLACNGAAEANEKVDGSSKRKGDGIWSKRKDVEWMTVKVDGDDEKKLEGFEGETDEVDTTKMNFPPLQRQILHGGQSTSKHGRAGRRAHKNGMTSAKVAYNDFNARL